MTKLKRFKQLNGQGSKPRQLTDGRWRVDGMTTVAGIRHQKSFYSRKSSTDADRKCQAWVRAIYQTDQPHRNSITLCDWLEPWLEARTTTRNLNRCT